MFFPFSIWNSATGCKSSADLPCSGRLRIEDFLGLVYQEHPYFESPRWVPCGGSSPCTVVERIELKANFVVDLVAGCDVRSSRCGRISSEQVFVTSHVAVQRNQLRPDSVESLISLPRFPNILFSTVYPSERHPSLLSAYRANFGKSPFAIYSSEEQI